MGPGRAQMNGPKWARDRAQMNGPNGPGPGPNEWAQWARAQQGPNESPGAIAPNFIRNSEPLQEIIGTHGAVLVPLYLFSLGPYNINSDWAHININIDWAHNINISYRVSYIILHSYPLMGAVMSLMQHPGY